MLLHTHTIGELAGVTAANLSETTADTSTLSLQFAGFGPDWLRYMEPVTLYHGGRVIFHGKITGIERSNSGGQVTTTATIANFLWLLNRQTLGQQIADIRAAAADGTGSATGKTAVFTGQLGKSSGSTSRNTSWGRLVETMAVSSDGWMPPGCTPEGGGSRLLVKASGSVSGRTVWSVSSKLITTASALHKLRARAADVQYVVDYERGTVTATAIGDMQATTIDCSTGALLAADGIAPQYEAQITGVAIAYTNDKGKVTLYRYPSGLDMAADGVKVFSLSGGYFVKSWKTVAREYYQAASVLQWGGSVTLLQSAVERSPLGGTLNLTGPGCHPEWATMAAVVTSADWDFMQGTLTLGLGRDFSDPAFADAQEQEDGGEDTGMEGDDFDPGSESFPVPDESFEDTAQVTDPGGSFEDTAETMDTGGSQSDQTQSGSQSQSSGTSSGSGAGSGAGSGSCSCESKWEQLAEWQRSIEERLSWLESMAHPPCGTSSGTGSGTGTGTGSGSGSQSTTPDYGTCSCSCNVTLADIEAAITAQLNAITWNLTTSGLLEENDNGSLLVNTTGAGNLSSGAAASQVNY